MVENSEILALVLGAGIQLSDRDSSLTKLNQTMYLRAELAAQDMIEQDFIVVQGHDLQDVLFRIGMLSSVSNFRRLLVRLNPQVNCDDPRFLAEVWGVEHQDRQHSMRCLYSANQGPRNRQSSR